MISFLLFIISQDELIALDKKFNFKHIIIIFIFNNIDLYLQQYKYKNVLIYIILGSSTFTKIQ